ncbi:MAG: DUF5104 domain-containing protein [Clostridia bacterium]|nr:DUF5104 domain-containing protein [Clostridia bacterium]
MKKTCIVLSAILLFVIVAVSLCGCIWSKTNAEAAKDNLEQLISCLEDNDHNRVKALFAPSRISNIEDFDRDIDELLDYFDGEFVSHDFRGPATFDDIDNGIKKKWFIISANITTSKGEFWVAMYWCDLDTENKDNVGIWSLYIFNHEDNPSNDFSFYPEGTWNEWSGITIVRM